MKKLTRGLLTVALALAATGVMAQENGNRDAQNRIVRGPYETNRFFDNIFIGVAGGVNIYHGENDSYGAFGKRLAPALDIDVGKWITPSVGLRIGYSGIQAKGWSLGQALYSKDVFDAADNIYDEKFGVSYLHGDFMWNFSNAVSGYKETRTWNFVPFIGAGWARSYGNGGFDNEIAVSVGLLNYIRLSNLLDLTIEARHMFVNRRFDGVVKGGRGEGVFSATMGLTFKLNRRGFKRVQPPVDVTPYLSRIEALEGDKEQLAGRNKTLAGENEALKNRKPERDTVTVAGTSSIAVSPVALFFGQGKATLDKKELVNLDFYMNNAIKADKNKIFTLTGSADSTTGSKAANQRLSERRTQYVYDLLVDKYGMAPERLVKKAVGDANNTFVEPELNRAVFVE